MMPFDLSNDGGPVQARFHVNTVQIRPSSGGVSLTSSLVGTSVEELDSFSTMLRVPSFYQIEDFF